MSPTIAEAAAAANPAHRPGRKAVALLVALLALPGCSTVNSVGSSIGNLFTGPAGPAAGQEGFVTGFAGFAVADEPRAAIAARALLSSGGTAADGAVAAGLTMAVTLPSRAGLGGGGACILYNPRRNEAEAIIFPPGPRSGPIAGADRPAAIPMLARGLFLLHTRGGRRPFEEAMIPAEQAARFGIEVSRAFAQDLAAVAGPLFADPWSAAAFGAGPGGRPPGVGDRLVQPDLGATLSVMRTGGVGELYQGGLARRLEEVSASAGAGLTVAELRAGLPRVAPAMQVRNGNDLVSFLPTDGGLAAAASFTALMAGGSIPAATSAGLAAAQAFRVQGGDPARLISTPAGGEAPMPPLPASASLVVLDREGMAVSCAFTMNNLFGTGRVAPGTGILLAAAPGVGRISTPLLAAGLAHNPNLRAFRAAAAGSGQEMAGIAAGAPLAAMLRGQSATAALAFIPDPGRGVAVDCPRYLPGVPGACSAAADPRGAGLASGGGE